jgi:uncharacterized beta-barrel protein YwiB (DUF1934 family)
MIYTPGERSKEISLSIRTIVIDEDIDPQKELGRLIEQVISGAELSDGELDGLLDDDSVDEIELLTEARIRTDKNGLVEIVYRENEDDEQLRTFSRIIFDPQNSGLLIMTKKGAINSSLSFENAATHICSYVTPYMPFKVYVTTKRLENDLLNSGRMHLDYILNIDDTAPQHFIVNIEIKEAPKDVLRELLASDAVNGNLAD